MNPPLAPRKIFRKLLILLVTLASVFFLYALSIGPATLLNKRGIISVHTLEKIYFPLSLVADFIPGSTDVIEFYMRLWVEE